MLHHEVIVPTICLDRDGARVPHSLMLLEEDNTSSQLAKGWWPEFQALRVARKALPPGAVILDCGAHIGVWSMFLSPFAAKIHAFEAVPATAAALRHNTTINGYKNVEIHNVPLWDKDGVPLGIIYGKGNHGHNSCHITKGGTLSRCLDSYDFDRVDFIKIDTEGAEARILTGARGILSKFKPYLMIEIHSWMHRDGVAYLRQISDILNEFGYRWGIDCLIRGT